MGRAAGPRAGAGLGGGYSGTARSEWNGAGRRGSRWARTWYPGVCTPRLASPPALAPSRRPRQEAGRSPRRGHCGRGGAGPGRGRGWGAVFVLENPTAPRGGAAPPAPTWERGGPLDPLGDLGESEHLGHLESGNGEPRGRLETGKPSPPGGRDAGGAGRGELGMDFWVSAKALGRRRGRRTPGCPRTEQGGCGESRGAGGLLPGVVRPRKDSPSPSGWDSPSRRQGGRPQLKVRVCRQVSAVALAVGCGEAGLGLRSRGHSEFLPVLSTNGWLYLHPSASSSRVLPRCALSRSQPGSVCLTFPASPRDGEGETRCPS